MDNRIEIMVDGSGDGHRWPCSLAKRCFFQQRGASNNEAEFNAVILALINLPDHAHARIKTDSQIVSGPHTGTTAETALVHQKYAEFQELIWQSPFRGDRLDSTPAEPGRRFLSGIISQVLAGRGAEPLHHRVRRLEAENMRLKAKLRKAMRMLESRR